ncbi:hypothetical protein EVAR_29765_1 [Eumeta japonica]|uniref:Uncharacterized protein n=1 Tax=Eumeta variegata TaxID=151549 RepID=A0A4C1WVI7_EUMVA|nr:hypothetical protein EVAR_29765_1 [Eumeta japonica]
MVEEQDPYPTLETSGHGAAAALDDTSMTIFEVGRLRTPPVVLTSIIRLGSGCQNPDRPKEHVFVELARCGSAAGAVDQLVLRRETLGLCGFNVHLRQWPRVDNVLGFQQ